MVLLSLSTLLLTTIYFVVSQETTITTRTFNVTVQDGSIKQYQYPFKRYSECLYSERRRGLLSCMKNYNYRDVAPMWRDKPEKIKYVKVNCLLTKYRYSSKGYCYCKDITSVPRDPSQEEKPYICDIKALNASEFSEYSGLEVLDLSDNYIAIIERQAFQGLSNLRYCDLDRNLLQTMPSGLFCDAPSLEFVSLNGLNLEHFPSHSFRCKTPLTNLTVIEAKGSNLKDVPADSLDYLPSIISLDLGSNEISGIYKKSFAGGTKLKYLNLTDNELTDLFPHFCMYMQTLSHLYLRMNRFILFNLDELDECVSLENLDLSHNTITTLSGNISAIDSLIMLDVSNNKISQLNVSFEPQSSLEHLDLSGNKLSTLGDNSFTGLEALKHLNLSSNTIENSTNFKEVFQGLKSLQHLDLSHNKLTSLPNDSFYKLNKVTALYLDNNRIHDISPNTFSGLASLQKLYLNNNLLMTLPETLLKPLTSLTYLSVSDNLLTSIEVSTWPALNHLHLRRNALTKLPSTILYPDLEYLDVAENRLSTFIGSNENLYINFARLKFLDISHNQISNMSPRVLTTMKSIEELHLHHNNLDFNLGQIWGVADDGVISQVISHTPNLTYLNIAFNLIPDITDIISNSSLLNLTYLNVSSNPLNQITKITDDPSAKLKVLDISNCSLQSLKQDIFSYFNSIESIYMENNKFETFPVFKVGQGTLLYLNGNPMICACNMSWVLTNVVMIDDVGMPVSNYKLPKCNVYTESGLYNPRLVERRRFLCQEEDGCDASCTCYKTLDTGPVTMAVCRKHLTSSPSTIPSSAESIFLDGNDFSDTSSLKTFLMYPAMMATELYLNNCAISVLDNKTFLAFNDLQIINLDDNVLEMLPSGIFKNNLNIKQIYLKNNLLQYFEINVFKGLTSLLELDISGNSLVTLPQNTLSDLSALTNIKYFFLARNQWSCNCTNRNFKKFVDKIEYKIRDRRQLVCDETQQDFLQLPLFSFICQSSTYAEDTRKPALIVSIIIVILIVFIIMAVLVYYRREVLALIYARFGCHIPGRSHHAGMHFDVYLSYDPKDQHSSMYVQNTLLPKLKNNSFNIQTADDLIEDAEVIQKVVEDSKSSIFVVNKNFTSNPFLLRVFNGATQTHKRDKLHKVVIIVHGDIDLNIVEPEIMRRLRKGDYITSRSKLWWERLIYELPVPSGLANAAENDDVSESDVIVFSSLTRDQQYDSI